MNLIIEPLMGKNFLLGKQDCYTLFRDFFQLNFGIEFPNYARPENFWEADMDLYMSRAFKHGFTILNCHPSEYQAGDVILMAINSTYGNHIGILLEDGQMLHHMYGRLSTKEPYKGIYRNTTIAVARHKDVVIETTLDVAHIDQYLTPKAVAYLNELRQAS